LSSTSSTENYARCFSRFVAARAGNSTCRRARRCREHVSLLLRERAKVCWPLAHFRRTGRGWQSRINAALRKAAKLPKQRKRA